MAAQTFDPFEPEGAKPLRTALPWVVGTAILAAVVWFIYTQLTASGIGVAVPAPSAQQISMLPPPPPPPPPEPQERPPEPTEQPQPSPAEAPQTPQTPPQQAAPVSIAAPAQAGSDAFGLQSGSGRGIGAPSSRGTCLGPNCGSAPSSGGGISVGMYTSYLRSTLQERVQDDPRLGRLVFSADYNLTISSEGRITGVRLRDARGGSDADMERLTALLGQVRGLDPPPPAMAFPQLVTVRGRRSSF